MGQLLRPESDQPCKECQQADVRGKFRRRIPPGARSNGHLQVASRNGCRSAVRQIDFHADGVIQRVRARTQEAA